MFSVVFWRKLISTNTFYDKQPSVFPHLPDLQGLPPLLVKHNLEAEVIPKLSGSEPIRRPLARIFTLLHFFYFVHTYYVRRPLASHRPRLGCLGALANNVQTHQAAHLYTFFLIDELAQSFNWFGGQRTHNIYDQKKETLPKAQRTKG